MSMEYSTTTQTTITPHSQQPYITRTYPSLSQVEATIIQASEAQKSWAKVGLDERIKIGWKFIDEFQALSETTELGLELTLQIGRPISQVKSEFAGFLDRGRYMLSIASQSLADVPIEENPGFKRLIKRVPLGVIFIIAPWNYPYLTSINSILPALIAGNAVILKPSPQSPLTAERIKEAMDKAGFPKGLFNVLHLTPELTRKAVQNPLVGFVSFTGSVVGGRNVEEAVVNSSKEGKAETGFKGVALELGGKDPAYVRKDVDLDYAVGELVDGAMYNSGQSCCAVERIYVHESVYDTFVEKYVEKVKQSYVLADPTLPNTNLGPVVSLASAARIRKQVEDAVKAGAKKLIPEELFPEAKVGTTYVAPQVLVDVDHSMDVMMEETFGPIIGIQKVSSDSEAIKLMNDSPYGLTASVWSSCSAPFDDGEEGDGEDAFMKIADGIETGTVYLNRCDYLDPALPWTGVKNSGRGVSLSRFGYDQLTRAKSVHMKFSTPKSSG
ncbi:succinate semialdehyde dehydrogenase [Lentinula raphanica]|uniref:Succinate semialdehyde dehydrogenase n=1 Tax=Lentinula raphanica TaxID=153919 RepID=A0AA38P367_9AGAR|nr:succinate semialdehyde dehydrogenase [Lentinula raphanica]KAJ3835281.1 succinate semialdehyde dehydrogenase [Lentinula raphanica]